MHFLGISLNQPTRVFNPIKNISTGIAYWSSDDSTKSISNLYEVGSVTSLVAGDKTLTQATALNKPRYGNNRYIHKSKPFDFDGTQQYFTSNFKLTDHTTNAVSIYIVCKPDKLSGKQTIFDNTDNAARGGTLYLNDGNVVCTFYNDNQSAVTISGPSSAKAGETRVYRVDCQNSGTVNLYENNNLIGTNTMTQTIRFQFNFCDWGTDNDHVTGWFDGTISHIYIAHSLTANEHTRLYTYFATQAGVISDTNPALSVQYPHPYIRWDENISDPIIDIQPTPENFVNPLFSDKWTNWHRMVITTTTTNGYVLGTLPVPPEQLTGGGTWSLTGDSNGHNAYFTINSTTGQITLTSAASITVAGDLYVEVNTPAGGVYPITIPVRDSSAPGTNFGNSFRFYDSSGVGTDYATDGEDVNNALNTVSQTLSSQTPETSYFKRGSTFTNVILGQHSKWPTPKNFLDYGDPSESDPKFIISTAYTGTGAFDGNPTQKPIGGFIEGLHIDCNNVAIRGINAVNWLNTTIRRVTITNNLSNVNANGFYLSDSDNNIIRWCKTYNHNGDGFYATNCYTTEIGFNNWGEASGSGADAGQTVNEGSTTQFNYDFWIHDNIGLVNPLFETGKGAFANEGNFRLQFERNWCQADFFCASSGDFYTTARHNFYEGHQNMTSTEFCTGHGPSQSSGPINQYCNITTHGGRGISYSGFNAAAENWQGDEYNRTDIVLFGNVGYDHVNFLHTDQPFTGLWEQNYGIEISNAIYSDNKGVATLDGTISAITVDSNGLMTLTLTERTHLYKGATITIADTINSVNNCTTTVSNMLSYTQITCQYTGAGTPVNSSGAGITYTGTPTYTAKTVQNNFNAAPTLASVPLMGETPVITGTCREGSVVTCTAKIPYNCTANYLWYINGIYQTGMSGATPTVTLGSWGADTHKADLIDLGKRINQSDLGCVVEITENDSNAYKNAYVAVWSDTGLPTKEIESVMEGLASKIIWTVFSELTTTTAITSVSDKWGGTNTLTGASTNEPSIVKTDYFNWFSRAAYFDGTEYLQNDSLATTYSGPGENLTLHMNFKADTAAGTQVLFGIGNSTTVTPMIWFGISGGNFVFTRRDDGSTQEIHTIATANTDIHTISIKDDGTNLSVWLDNTKVINNVAWNVGIGAITLNTLTVGALNRNGTVGSYFTGYIENLALFDDIHTDTETLNSHSSILL